MPPKSQRKQSTRRPKVRRGPKTTYRKVTRTHVIRGRGDYTVGAQGTGPNSSTSKPGFLERLAAPFINDTASVGLVNRGARFAGNALGDWTGIPGAGRALGNAASSLSRFLGFGDYKLQRNCLANDSIAQFKGAESTVLSGREFITNIAGSNVFNSRSFIINPGNSACFPWLSTVARNYENWDPLGIVFEFRTTSAFATGTTNSALGTVIQATDYDVVDTPYADKQQMLISTFANSQAPCTSFYHPIECDSRKNPLGTYYVQTGSTAASYPDDPRFSALGNYQIATEGMQVTNVIGELWVSYKFKFSKPQLALTAELAYSHTRYGLQVNGNAFPVFERTIAPFVLLQSLCTTSEHVIIQNLPPGDYMLYVQNKAENIAETPVTPLDATVVYSGGANPLKHSVDSSGGYGFVDSNNGGDQGAIGIDQYTTWRWLMFSTTSLSSTVLVPLYTWSGGVYMAYRDIYINAIPHYENNVGSSDSFVKNFMRNKDAILQLMQCQSSSSSSSSSPQPALQKSSRSKPSLVVDTDDYQTSSSSAAYRPRGETTTDDDTETVVVEQFATPKLKVVAPSHQRQSHSNK